MITASAERFWSKVSVTEGCWEWQRGLFRNGYGQACFDGKKAYAHRLAWAFTNGPILDGLHVCHRCDNRKCCNPGHLFLGTRTDNMRDASAKGRTARGEGHGQSKLTESLVTEIRSRAASGETQRSIAKAAGISEALCSLVVNRKYWRHVA